MLTSAHQWLISQSGENNISNQVKRCWIYHGQCSWNTICPQYWSLSCMHKLCQFGVISQWSCALSQKIIYLQWHIEFELAQSCSDFHVVMLMLQSTIEWETLERSSHRKLTTPCIIIHQEKWYCLLYSLMDNSDVYINTTPTLPINTFLSMTIPNCWSRGNMYDYHNQALYPVQLILILEVPVSLIWSIPQLGQYSFQCTRQVNLPGQLLNRRTVTYLAKLWTTS